MTCETVSFVNAIRYSAPVEKGISRAHIFDCDDNNGYLVKFFDNRKTITNEFVGGRLAMCLGLPSPKVALVKITQDLIDLSQAIQKRNIRGGIHVGSRFQEYITDFDHLTLQVLDGKILVNPEALYGVICFDTWLLNGDRDNTGNNMIEFLSDNRTKYWMIDFSHCFAGIDWNETLLASRKNDQQIMPRFNYLFRKYITDRKGFDDWFIRLETIPDADIQHIVDSIPEEWSLNPKERDELSDTIKRRRTLVRHIIADSGIL